MGYNTRPGNNSLPQNNSWSLTLSGRIKVSQLYSFSYDDNNLQLYCTKKLDANHEKQQKRIQKEIDLILLGITEVK